ncbi:DUF6928 family protein [Gordonia hydrophobica]|uniref:Uncharacterized protein n=1 Tax=Gordonia hydrophobica TaxID=40516 RepID=A0ABZ2U389_9ACTN|nr:hypothetical protein [Gordonia hydrophobica]MBM7367484.1 hypothetical protein [Gordonia hydrophobica]
MLPNISVLWFIDCDDPAAELRSGVYIDPAQTTDFMDKAFAETEITPIGTSDLAAAVNGVDNRVFAAHFGSVAVLAGASLRTAEPSELTSYLADLGVGHTWALVSIDQDTDLGCFARWEHGDIQRAFAGTSSSIKVDAGLPHPFEGPFWAGEHPQAETDDPLALPFHPGLLADAAHHAWLGFGFRDAEPMLDPASIPVTVYRVGPDDGRDQYIESSVALSANAAAHPGDADPGTADPGVEAAGESPGAAPEDRTETFVTEPIEKVAVPATALDADEKHARTPGPISRYFGFRGRL